VVTTTRYKIDVTAQSTDNLQLASEVDLLGCGYNYHSTYIRLRFDRATSIRRPTLRPGCCTAA